MIKGVSPKDIQDQRRRAELLIRECYAVQFSVGMVASLLLLKSGPVSSLDHDVDKSPAFGKLSDEHSRKLAEELNFSLKRINKRMTDFLPSIHLDLDADNVIGASEDKNFLEYLSLQKKVNVNIELLDKLKKYLESDLSV